MNETAHYSIDIGTMNTNEKLGEQPTDKPGREEHTAFVNRKIWGQDDTYLTVECQVMESNFNVGDKVKVTIERV